MCIRDSRLPVHNTRVTEPSELSCSFQVVHSDPVACPWIQPREVLHNLKRSSSIEVGVFIYIDQTGTFTNLGLPSDGSVLVPVELDEALGLGDPTLLILLFIHLGL